MTVQVFFPCIHGLANGQLVTINCFPSEELKGTIKVVTGVDEEIAKRVIGASRFNESDSRAGIGVMALFSNPLFSGESYGLALAVADKLSRFETQQQWAEIYATGTIPADGCGRVTTISGFAEKLDLLIEKAKPTSLFIYPESNLLPSFNHIQEKLDLLCSKGVTCVAVSTVDDLQGKLWLSGTDKKSKSGFENISERIANMPMTVWQTVLGLSFIGIVCFFLYLVFRASFGDSALKWTNQDIQAKKNISSEVKKREFSHQEIKQEERITDTGVSPSSEPAHDNKKVKPGAGMQHRPLILESTDTDSSLY